MSSNQSSQSAAADTLLLPFQEGVLDPPADADSTFLLRGYLSPELSCLGWRDSIQVEQSSRTDFLQLEQFDLKATDRISGEFDLGLCLFTKHKKENYGNIARAFEHLKPGGKLVCAGHNQIGIKSLEKNIGKSLKITDRITKNHCRVFWIENIGEQKQSIPDEWRSFSQQAQHIKDSPFQTQPGMFSWNKIDGGSSLLTKHFPKTIKGKVADFGSGWGFLSSALIERFNNITLLDLYEDEKLALHASQQNLPEDDERIHYHWHNLAGEPLEPGQYDWVITNPPFHTSARTDVTLGCQFIEKAARVLKPKGSLIMVANRQLPYEAKLAEHFGEVTRLAEHADFKVIQATRKIR